jgi:integrase
MGCYFLKSCKALHAQDVTAHDVAAYWQFEVDNSPTKSYRTAHNRVTSLGAFLKAHNVDVKWKISPFVEETPEVFEQEEIDAILGACDLRPRAAYSAMYQGLLREKEVVYLTWDCVDTKRSVIHVKAQPQWDWKPKKHHERSVKVPRSLMNLIDALPRTSRLVFAREDGESDGHLLRYIKDAAVRAGLDPDRVWNHKLRASSCTRSFQAGMPMSDIMRLGAGAT